MTGRAVLPKLLVRVIRAAARSSASEPVNLSTVRSVVAVELSRLGDAVEILPALQHFQRNLPSASIHCMVRKEYASLLQLCDIDVEVHAAQRAGIAGIAYAARELRTLRPDLVLSMSPSRSNALVTLLSSARLKAGYLHYSDSLTPFLGSHEVEVIGASAIHAAKYGGENISQRSVKVLYALGLSSPDRAFPLQLRKKQADEIRTQLIQREILPSEKYILLHPFSAWEYRNWPSGNFASLAGRAQRVTGMKVVLICHSREFDRLRNIFVEDSPGVHFASIDNIAELAVSIANASLFVGNDSGPLHLAAVLGTRAVGIFGPASPGFTAPPDAPARYVYRPVVCSPCDQRKCIRQNDPCMHQYTVDEVFASVQEMLEATVTQNAATHV